jgi:hypothetical protein
MSGVGAVSPNIGKKLGQLLRRASSEGGFSSFLETLPSFFVQAS